jgi:hypothetical protein
MFELTRHLFLRAAAIPNEPVKINYNKTVEAIPATLQYTSPCLSSQILHFHLGLQPALDRMAVDFE